MIQRKADHECVSVRIDRLCERHKELVLEKQVEITKESGGRKVIGKERAIKAILDDYDKQKLVINELRVQLEKCMKPK